MVSALVSKLRVPSSSPTQGHCVVFLGNTRYSQGDSLQYKWVTANLMLGVTLEWTSISSRGGEGRGEGGIETLLAASCYGNLDKLLPYERTQ